MTRAVIVGSGGQDGQLLFDLLAELGLRVIGIERSALRLNGVDDVSPEPVDILDRVRVAALLQQFQPHEVYYLAAYHVPAERQPESLSSEIWQRSFDVHVHGLLSFLEGIRFRSPATRLFYACSSLVFGHPTRLRQNERTPLAPRSPYAISKAAGWQCCRLYRERWSVFASVGILYNHESHLRPDAFVSQKIVEAAVRIRAGYQQELVLGDLAARVDWGSAEDFVRAVVAILQLSGPDDFVIATGQAHTVADLARVAFECVGLNWKDFVREQPDVIREPRPVLVGDASKLRAATGWQPSTSFEQLIQNMVASRRGERKCQSC